MDVYHYEEVQLSDMRVEDGMLYYPCPCGDLFELALHAFAAGDSVAQCPTCSLTVKIVCTDEERQRFATKHASAIACAAVA